MDKSVTVRIKKVFFDKIASGEKTIEYRNITPFYKIFENPDVKTILFHYQKNPRLIAEIIKIEKVKAPEGWKTTPYIYAIHLGAILKYNVDNPNEIF